MTSQPPRTSAGQGSGHGLGEELKHDAEHLGGTVAERGRQEAETRKNEAAHAVGAASAAFDDAAGDLRADPDVPDWMASALQQAARKIETMASQIEGRSVHDISSQVARFARENPGSFLAASAAAGFAAARVLRAGADHKRHDREGVDRDETQGGYAQSNHAGIPQAMTRNIAPGYIDVHDRAEGGAS
jgi:hypothetical protein